MWSTQYTKGARSLNVLLMQGDDQPSSISLTLSKRSE